jgi:hypothetical protein
MSTRTTIWWGVAVTRRTRWSVRVVVATLLAGLVIPTAAFADEGGGPVTNPWAHYALVGVDAVIVRPVGCVVVIVGAIVLVPVALITWISGGDVDPAVEVFVSVPAQDLLKRPLGRF